MTGFFSRLFGGGTPTAAADATTTEEYKGYSITGVPEKSGGQYRIAAIIEKGGQNHQLIRADTLRDRDAAVEASVAKAKQAIDHLGDRLFD